MRPSVSIVITNHDYARFLGAAIDSALAQTHPDTEVIVVDDGSRDASLHVLTRYAGRVAAVLGPNEGQAAAINRGFAKSSGDVVIFLDADDMLTEDIAERVAAVIAENPSLSRVQYPLEIVDRDGLATGDSMPHDPDRLFRGDAVERLLSCPDDIPWQPTSGNAFTRHALDSILPMPTAAYRICADFYLSTLAPLAGPVQVLDEAGGRYRVHGDNSHFERTTLARVRADVHRTVVTHGHLIAHARRRGLVGLPDHPDDVPSVSHVVQRIVSHRLSPDQHPVRGDGRRRLARLGVSSARRRRDLPRWRRIATGAWLATTAVAPSGAVRVLARPVVRMARTERTGGHAGSS